MKNSALIMNIQMNTIKIIFLLLLTASIFTCCDKDTIEPEISKDILLSDNHKDVFLKKRGHWDLSNNRVSTYSSYSENTFFESASLTIRFNKEVKELTLNIIDSDAQVIFKDEISAEKNISYSIPVTFIQGEKYYISIIDHFEYYYLDFSIEGKNVFGK